MKNVQEGEKYRAALVVSNLKLRIQNIAVEKIATS